jgi:hypothetical protein
MMSAIHAALMYSYRTSNVEVVVSNCVAHVSWTEHAVCQWNGQAHILSVMKAPIVLVVVSRDTNGLFLSCVRHNI